MIATDPKGLRATDRPAFSMPRAVALAMTCVLVLTVPPAAADFADTFGPKLESLAREFGESVARSLPLPAASPGTAPVFLGGVVTSVRSIVGQLYLERPDTIGAGSWNLAVGYQWVRFSTLDGEDLDALRDVSPPICGARRCTTNPYVIPHLDLGLDSHELILNGTWGVTSEVELNVTLPLIVSEFRVRARFRELERPRSMPIDRTQSAVGPGDLVLRVKYQPRLINPPGAGTLRTALGFVLRLPSGDAGNFQGTGSTGLSPRLYLSSLKWTESERIQAVPYVNLRIDYDTNEPRRSEAGWGVGLDTTLLRRATVAVAVLGRHAFTSAVSSDAFDVARCPRSQGPCQGGEELGVAPLFGLRLGRLDTYDLSAGVRFDVGLDWLFPFANAIVPLNRDGLRADVVPLVGVEGTFGKASGE